MAAKKKNSNSHQETRQAAGGELQEGKEKQVQETAPTDLLRTARVSTKVSAPLERVARFLLLIGTERAAPILQHFTAEEVEKITAEMIATSHIGPEEIEELIHEFSQINTSTPILRGGMQTAKELLQKSFGDERAESIMHKVFPDQLRESFSFLAPVPAENIHHHIREESLPVICIILACLHAATAAKVLCLFPPDTQRRIVQRSAKLSEVSREVVERTAAKLKEQLSRAQPLPETKLVDGVGRLADILKHSNNQTGDSILADIAHDLPELEQDLRERLFTIDALYHVPQRQLQDILSNIDDIVLAQILIGVDTALADHIRSHISAGRHARIEQEMAFIDASSRRDIQQSIADFLQDLRKKHADGELILQDLEEFI